MGSGSRRSRRGTRHHLRGGRCAAAQRDLPAQAIDALVERHDPAARRRTETAVRSRYIDVEHRGGIASVSGELHCTDATLLDRRLTALARTVCGNDPHTIDQRRADALCALAAGHTTLACACGMSDCATAETPVAASVVVHVVAEPAARDDPSTPDLNGERTGDGAPEIVRDPERFAELIREATSTWPIPKSSTEPMHNPTPNPGVVLGGPVITRATSSRFRGSIVQRALVARLRDAAGGTIRYKRLPPG